MRLGVLVLVCTLAEIRHGHHVHHHTGPAGKVLSSLPLTRVWIILFPGETGFLPLLEDVLDQVLTQLRVHFPRLVLVRTLCDGGILYR